jgi:hypothetical protein
MTENVEFFPALIPLSIMFAEHSKMKNLFTLNYFGSFFRSLAGFLLG